MKRYRFTNLLLRGAREKGQTSATPDRLHRRRPQPVRRHLLLPGLRVRARFAGGMEATLLPELKRVPDSSSPAGDTFSGAVCYYL